MKIECSVDKIKKTLNLVERITGKNLTLPVLNSILLTTSNSNLELKATNLNLGIEIKIPAKIEKEGTVAIKGDVLLKSIPHDDFPTIPIIKGQEIIIPNKKFIEGIKAVYYSSAISEIKPEIGSVYIYPEDDMLVFVATDSFRLSEKKIKIKQKLSFNGILIPFKNIIEIIKIFDNIDDDLKITIQKNQISFSLNNIYLTSRIIDGGFPDYKQIIPKIPTTKVVVLKQDLLSSLKISNIFSDKFNQITLNINPKNKKLEIESKNSDVGENKSLIEGVLSGEEISVNFNYKYILDCFQSIESDSLSLELSGNNRAMIIKGVGDQSFLYLIMPMNR